jgi:transcriptional regulator of acetoin/glycerol metabolism
VRENRLVAIANHTAVVSRDAREIPIEDSAAPIRDYAGRLVGVVLVFHDVTEKRRAEQIHVAFLVTTSADGRDQDQGRRRRNSVADEDRERQRSRRRLETTKIGTKIKTKN